MFIICVDMNKEFLLGLLSGFVFAILIDFLLFFNIQTPCGPPDFLDRYKAMDEACRMLASKGYESSTDSVLLKDFDANNNGKTNDPEDTMLELCKNYFDIYTDIDCKKTCGYKSYFLTFEKEAYSIGEVINFNFTFEEKLYVNPLFKIDKHVNNTWNYLGEWDFDGTQYICCGLKPSCEEYSSPIQMKWDQKIAEGSLPIISENYTKKNVEPGRYKFFIIYGDDETRCTHVIQKEIVIK